ncbi:flagellar protein FliT [Janthinobacterium sp.]|uniref:flagellar protein FliT n=1 Tax=unclassified Janthinobacterium TaxID=2610881 RepID=UPI002DBAEDCE|nr:flagellar protein FliT [Janthinobacterium sp.]HEU4817200.1 flagellar protein FliT [Janthinobacterium sp.]
MTNKMVVAARSSDWNDLDALENQCASAASATMAGKVPALAGASRLRKIDLLKQILANDREIRAITEPWMTQLSNAMPGSRARM